MHLLTVNRMNESDLCRMEHQPFTRCTVIESISHNRCIQSVRVSGMDA